MAVQGRILFHINHSNRNEAKKMSVKPLRPSLYSYFQSLKLTETETETETETGTQTETQTETF